MNDGSGVLVLWILAPLFVAVGLYVIWYSRRRKKMLEAFASRHGLQFRPDREQDLQRTLDTCFSLQDAGLVRSFGQLSSLVDGGSVWLFRAVELLDLDPHAQSYSTHFPRIAALFAVSTDHDAFFVLDRSMQASQRLPGSKAPDPEITENIRRIATSCRARHALSVTLKKGQGLIYFEPLVTGGEALRDVESLHCTARKVCQELSGNV